MIIDMHRHIWSISERYPRVRELASGGAQDWVREDSNDIQTFGGLDRLAEQGTQIVQELDAAGVDKTIVFLGDYGLLLGEGTHDIMAENFAHVELASLHPERIIPFFGIDPRRPGAADYFETALREWKVRGLKLHPATGYSPSDDICWPLYKLAGEYGVPVAIHTGPMASPLLSDTCQPVRVDRPAAEFPETKFIMLHAGQCWWREALNIAFWKSNIYLELSMWQFTYLNEHPLFVRALALMKATIGTDRLLFGSDHPGLSSTLGLSDWVAAFRKLPEEAPHYGGDVTTSDVDAILGENAASLLRVRDVSIKQDDLIGGVE